MAIDYEAIAAYNIHCSLGWYEITGLYHAMYIVLGPPFDVCDFWDPATPGCQ